ncbi:hypothetical protein IQ249_22315 [Lusitaniella coriacea LEGE 07157]|uniref:Uncharacterized protein n=1 Tax=Lusitaniella coriacea LEGE 07157 TaxID=945747 RepID=A0A8J7E056_9CYAN|nr:hypothetical protein [Lusitaniella coriacea]MBE9118628.1 hypothetical protein [Lusitaniella coriacea LEGE 07157]
MFNDRRTDWSIPILLIALAGCVIITIPRISNVYAATSQKQLEIENKNLKAENEKLKARNEELEQLQQNIQTALQEVK